MTTVLKSVQELERTLASRAAALDTLRSVDPERAEAWEPRQQALASAILYLCAGLPDGALLMSKSELVVRASLSKNDAKPAPVKKIIPVDRP